MSAFVSQLNDYCRRYGISSAERLLFLVHYPAFKLMWLNVYGSPGKQRIARKLIPLFRHHHLAHTVSCWQGEGRPAKHLRLALPFEENDFEAFMEILWAEEYGSILQLRPIRTLVDLGANIGFATLFCGLRAGLRKALLVEANPQLIPRIKENLKPLDGIVTTDVVNACIGRENGKDVQFVVRDSHRHSYMVTSTEPAKPGDTIINVPMRSLASILAEHGLKEVDLFKFDVEGAEYELLDDEASMRAARHIVAEVHGQSPERDKFAMRLSALGFDLSFRTPTSPVSELLLASRKS